MRILYLMLLLGLWAVSAARADVVGDLGTLVVQASRSDDTAGDMNKDVDIITSEQIAESPAKNLPELLATLPGVDARVNSSIKDTQIDMGGFGESSVSNVVVLVDGRRLNNPDFSGADLSLINLDSIDHIEVIQGAGTVLYGDNADGGVINIVTKKGTENTKPSVTLTSEVDSYKGNKDGASVSGGLPTVTYQFDYDRQQSDNYRTDNDFWANDYDTHVNYNPTDVFGIDFSQGYHLDRYQLPGAISINDYTNYLYGTTVDGIDSVGRTGVNPLAIANGTTSDSYFDVTPHAKWDEGSTHIDLSLFTSARKYIANIEDPGSGYATNYEEESYEFQPKAIVTSPLTDILDNKMTAGYDYIDYREKRRVNSPGDLEDIVYATDASQSVYLLDEMTMDQRWLLNVGARGAWADYVFNQTEQTPTKFDRSPTTEGYEGGLGYKYNPDSKVFVDYSHTYRLPLLDEFFGSPFPGPPGSDNAAYLNPNLTYQVGNQYQLGIKDHSIKNVNLGFTATEVQYKNEIYDDPILLDTNYPGRTRHISEEGDISVGLLNRRIEPFANVTFQQSLFVGGPYAGSQIPDVPDHLARAGVIFRPIENLSTSFTDNFVGKRFAIGDDMNIFPKVKRYGTLDWNIKYDFKNMEFWFSLNNIFNTQYYVYGSAYGLDNAFNYGPTSDFAAPEVYYPAPGRNVQAGVKVAF